MRANRLSVAAIAALAVATSAFAADALVPYGQISGEVGSYYDTTSEASVLGVASYSSRFGLKGAADVGGGLTAVYQLEAGFNGVNDPVGGIGADNPAGTIDRGSGNGGLASRNTFAGIAGSFGTFVIGNHDTPYKIVARGAGAISSADTVAELKLNVDRRLEGAIAYIAPAEALGGITLAVAAVPVKDSNRTSENDGFHLSLGVLAPIGDTGLTVGAGYESAYAPAFDDTANSFFAAVTFKQDLFSVGVAFENTTVNPVDNAGYTTILVPVKFTLNDGLYVNAAFKLTSFDEAGAAVPGIVLQTAALDDADGSSTEISASVGKKFGKNLDLYAGIKSFSTDNSEISGADIAVGLKVAFE
jgi:predicted porin